MNRLVSKEWAMNEPVMGGRSSEHHRALEPSIFSQLNELSGLWCSFQRYSLKHQPLICCCCVFRIGTTHYIYIYTTTLYSAGIFSIENVGQHVATAPAISNNRWTISNRTFVCFVQPQIYLSLASKVLLPSWCVMWRSWPQAGHVFAIVETGDWRLQYMLNIYEIYRIIITSECHAITDDK